MRNLGANRKILRAWGQMDWGVIWWTKMYLLRASSSRRIFPLASYSNQNIPYTSVNININAGNKRWPLSRCQVECFGTFSALWNRNQLGESSSLKGSKFVNKQFTWLVSKPWIATNQFIVNDSGNLNFEYAFDFMVVKNKCKFKCYKKLLKF